VVHITINEIVNVPNVARCLVFLYTSRILNGTVTVIVGSVSMMKKTKMEI
jgi:hypothetical protein